MTNDASDFFLFIGSANSESATTQIRSSGMRWQTKSLSSRVDNWHEIIKLIEDDTNRGCLLQLTASDYNRIATSHEYDEISEALFKAVSKKQHIVFVHEAVFLTEGQRGGSSASAQGARPDEGDSPPLPEEDEVFGRVFAEVEFPEVPDEVRQAINSRLRGNNLKVRPYKSNYERAVMAKRFLEDGETGLLFRIYVPSGRIYAQEASALLKLFKEWLRKTNRSTVRQSGYETAEGEVIEFHSTEASLNGGLKRYVSDFKDYIEACVSDPDGARNFLIRDGMHPSAASGLVEAHGKRVKRITLDASQLRELQIMEIKHEIQNTAMETAELDGDELQTALELWAPKLSLDLTLGEVATPQVGSTVINNYTQNIGNASGLVAMTFQGSANYGVEARDLLGLIASHAGAERSELETAVYEIEDVETRGDERVGAKSRIRAFLADLGARGVTVGANVMQKYLEAQAGL